jgi:hypothetical protein
MSRQDVEAVAERLRDLNEEIIDAGRRVGGPVLVLYEQALRSIAPLPERLGGGEQVEWFATIVAAQADFMRAIAEAYTSSADRTPEHSRLSPPA